MDVSLDFLNFLPWPLGNMMPSRFSKDKKAFLPVLINPGASDPRISVLQVLHKTPEFRQAWERKRSNSSSDWDLKHSFDDLQWDRTPQFKYECKIHDAAEHMEQLLKDLSAEVSQAFRGTLVCTEGHCVSETSRFSTLPLPLSASVEQGLQQMFDCNSTCETKTVLKDKQKTPPQILVFHLKRFDLKTSHVKSECEVELTETLQTQGHSYSLWAVVDHWGSVREGFYTAIVSENGDWYKFDDRKKRTDAPRGKKSSTAVLIVYRQNEETNEFYRTNRDKQGWMESNKSYTGLSSCPYYGLMNQGATCYLNSVLQVLFMTPEFRKALEKASNQTDFVLKRLFDKLQNELCGTETITRNLQAPNVQRCAAEYLEILLNRVSPEVSKPFHGELLDITLCSKKHCINQEASKFWTLPLSMERISSVAEGFEKFFQAKKLRGIHCNECEKEGKTTTEAISKYEMAKPPQILVLLIKRFNIDHRTGYNYKSQCEIEIPGTLPTEGLIYSLCGIVDHSGGLGGGHYTATIQSMKDAHWYRFDDTHVRQVQVPYSRSATAYLLIYRALMSESTGTEDIFSSSGKNFSDKGNFETTLEKEVPQPSNNGEDLMDWESDIKHTETPVQKDIWSREEQGTKTSSGRSKEGQGTKTGSGRSKEGHGTKTGSVRDKEGQSTKTGSVRDKDRYNSMTDPMKSVVGQNTKPGLVKSREEQDTQAGPMRSTEVQDAKTSSVRSRVEPDIKTGPPRTNEVHQGHREYDQGSWDKDRSSGAHMGSGHMHFSNEGQPGHKQLFGDEQRAAQHKDLSTQRRPGHRDWSGQGY